jgi:hypothetical protein
MQLTRQKRYRQKTRTKKDNKASKVLSEPIHLSRPIAKEKDRRPRPRFKQRHGQKKTKTKDKDKRQWVGLRQVDEYAQVLVKTWYIIG